MSIEPITRANLAVEMLQFISSVNDASWKQAEERCLSLVDKISSHAERVERKRLWSIGLFTEKHLINRISRRLMSDVDSVHRALFAAIYNNGKDDTIEDIESHALDDRISIQSKNDEWWQDLKKAKSWQSIKRTKEVKEK